MLLKYLKLFKHQLIHCKFEHLVLCYKVIDFELLHFNKANQIFQNKIAILFFQVCQLANFICNDFIHQKSQKMFKDKMIH